MFTQYRRHLPHLHPPGAALFLTMRLAGSLPQAALAELPQTGHETGHDVVAHRRSFAAYEQQLERGGYGPIWLTHAVITELVLSGLRQQAANAHYELLAACAMPNHLHLVLRLPPNAREPFYRVLQRFKSATAVQANRHLARSGRFWQDETYDHVVRESQPLALLRAIRYTVHNPVKAGLCATWEEWPGTHLAPDWREEV